MRPRVAPLLSSFSPFLLLSVWAATLLATRSVRASDCSSIDSACIDSDILWPHAGPSHFLSIGSAETIAQGQVGFGLVTTYLSRPILLHVPTPGPSGSDQNAVDDQVNGTFLWAYGVTPRLELDLALPVTFIQSGAGLSPLTGGDGLKDTAVRDMRFGLAYALFAHEPSRGASPPSGFGLTARAEVSAPTGDDRQFASDGAGVFVPSVAADFRQDRFFVGLEVGGRLRPIHQLLGARVGSQLTTALGVGYDVLPHQWLTAAVEAWALPTFAEQDSVSGAGTRATTAANGTMIAPAEWQLSVRTAPLPSGDLSVQVGGGGELPLTNAAITMPRFRFTLGIRWAPQAHEVAVATKALPPAASAPAVDLHLAGAKDVCTTDPDLVDGFKDTDGCPDEDQDKDGVPDRLDKCPMVPEDFVGLTDGCPEKH